MSNLSQIKSLSDFNKTFEAFVERIARDSQSEFAPGSSTGQRKADSKLSIWNFARTYMPHYMTKPAASFHADWEEAARYTGEPMLIEAFREAGKSTFFSFLDVLHAICFHRANFILLGAYTVDRAQMFSSRILAELIANSKLLADFGQLIGKQNAAIGLFKAKDTTVQAISIGQNPRGLVAGPHRPDFVRLDDIQDQGRARNPKIVAAAVNWITMALVPALANNYNLKIVGPLK